MKSNRKVLIFNTKSEAVDFLYSRWCELAEEAVSTRGRFTVALSGGRTPVMFYNKLAELDDFDLWLKTHIFLTDERFVPKEDPASNFGMIQRNLFPMQKIPESNYHPVPTDLENVSVAAEEYKNMLLRFFVHQHSGVPSFDFCLLGVGEDGHTASLFPGREGEDGPQRWTVPVTENYLKQERVSLTLSVLNQARFSVVLGLGANKAAILKAILEDSYDCPAARLSAAEGELLFVLDREAASQLSQKDVSLPVKEN